MHTPHLICPNVIQSLIQCYLSDRLVPYVVRLHETQGDSTLTEIVSFGEWIQARRNQLGLSRTGLARQVGCSPVTIKKIEWDERRPSVQVPELLAAHLQILAFVANGRIVTNR